MPYQFVEFDDVPLPLLMHDQNHQPMPIESTLMDTAGGGAYDWSNGQKRRGRKQTIAPFGEFIGETTYIVDEDGDFLVDESGNFIIAGNAEQIVHAKVSAILAKIDTVGTLWRKRLADDALHWKTARLLAVPWQRNWEDHGIRARIVCEFETSMQFWHAETATEATLTTTTAGTAELLWVEHGGQEVNDAVLTMLVRTNNTVTALNVVCTALGIDFTWTGSLTEGATLTMDFSDGDAPTGVTDAYNGLTRNAGHTARGWLPIPAGTHAFYVTTTGGIADVTISFYEQYA